MFADNKSRTVPVKERGWRDRNVVTVEASLVSGVSAQKSEPLKGAYFWLAVFYVAYCARPEDWIPGLHSVPLAKISGLFAMLGLLLSLGRSKRGLRDLPREALYLLLLIGMFFVSAGFSPVWKGGAFFRTLDFAKVFVAFVLTFFAVTSLARLRRLLFIQTASVVVISMVSMVKGASHPRLDGVLGGIYSNPNDLAFAIVLSLPFGLAFFLRTDSVLRKAVWAVSLSLMIERLVSDGLPRRVHYFPRGWGCQPVAFRYQGTAFVLDCCGGCDCDHRWSCGWRPTQGSAAGHVWRGIGYEFTEQRVRIL